MQHHTLLPRYARALVLPILLGLLTVLPPAAVIHAAGVIYVVPGGAGAQTGIDWDNAKDLQAALTSAASGDEIWVKAGSYKPTSSADRSATFQLKSGVALYGGFAGSEASRDLRDPAAHISVLSGDLLGDDAGAVASTNATRGENSYHVVTGSGTDVTGVIDGFTITGGQASGASLLGFGGGIFIQNGSPTVQHSIFKLNYASMGGGMSNYNASPVVSNLIFTGNRADSGAGIGNTQSNPSISQVTLSDNVTAYNGGGIANFYDSSPNFSHVTLSGNSSAQAGGGMANEYNSSPTLDNVVFSNNTANIGGAMLNYDRSSPIIRHSLFDENAAVNSGGGMASLNNSHPIVGHTTFRANSAKNGGGMDNGSSTTIISSIFISNTASLVGGGILNEYSSSTIVQSIFSGNSSGTYGSAIANYQSNSTISQVTFSANQSKNNGGTLSNQSSSPLIRNSIFWGNQGGQVYNYLTGNVPDVQYSLIQGGYSAGTHIINADPLFVDADGADNIAGTPDDDLRLQNGSPAIDAGNNAFIPADLTDDNNNSNITEAAPFDLDGNARLDGPIVDLGAYEAQVKVRITSALPPAGTYGSSYSHTFTATAVLPVTYSVTAGSLPPGIGLNATAGLLSGTPTAAGSYSGITITASNADGSASQTFTIVIHPVALTVTADSQSKSYGAINPSLTASYAGFVGGDTTTALSGSPNCTTTSTIASGVGTYSIHCTLGTLAAANYSFTFTDGALDVSPAALTITANNQVKYIGTANPLLTASYSGFVNNDTPASLDAPVSLTTTATISSAPGAYPITASDAADANYAISFVGGTLTVTAKLVPVIDWAAPAAITYGTALGPAQLNATTTISGTFSYTPAAGTTLSSGNNQPLLVTFTPDDGAAYAVVQAAVNINIQRAALTIAADNKSRAFGVANPPLTVSYSGFVNNDTPASLDAPLSLTTTATIASAPGIYPITVSGAAATNYDITLTDATLTVGNRRTYLALVSR